MKRNGSNRAGLGIDFGVGEVFRPTLQVLASQLQRMQHSTLHCRSVRKCGSEPRLRLFNLVHACPSLLLKSFSKFFFYAGVFIIAGNLTNNITARSDKTTLRIA